LRALKRRKKPRRKEALLPLSLSLARSRTHRLTTAEAGIASLWVTCTSISAPENLTHDNGCRLNTVYQFLTCRYHPLV
jgi:hypothetical protein